LFLQLKNGNAADRYRATLDYWFCIAAFAVSDKPLDQRVFMPIKTLRFSFDVTLPALLSLVAAGTTGLKIDVLGSDKIDKNAAKLLNGHAPKLLESPERVKARDAHGKRITAKTVILAHLFEHKDRACKAKELGEVVAANGFGANSHSPVLTNLKQAGFVKRSGAAMYQITAKGITHVSKGATPHVET
jgi:hypothetical protein